jgi:phosphoribosylanthranilate isomerase
MFVKICGLTNLEDTLAAADAGAKAVGFNFVPTSPRFIEEARLAEWIRKVPDGIWKVGVFADQAPEAVADICERLGLEVAQLHGSELPAAVPANMRVWKAARINASFSAALLDEFQTEAVLLDGPASGMPFDWAKVHANGRKVILAGGLEAGNVCDAIRTMQPWGVDVCSRIETAPGRKDHKLMTQFIEMALSC